MIHGNNMAGPLHCLSLGILLLGHQILSCCIVPCSYDCGPPAFAETRYPGTPSTTPDRRKEHPGVHLVSTQVCIYGCGWFSSWRRKRRCANHRQGDTKACIPRVCTPSVTNEGRSPRFVYILRHIESAELDDDLKSGIISDDSTPVLIPLLP
ncbi:hypothetical protein IW262DRAFT_1418462 [Armillaria fumosa]|nr:hypothetical protein IW262DRAFT_1418462 [Armillaria fumosa]